LPSKRPVESRSDRLFYYALLPFASTAFAIILATLAILVAKGAPALQFYGLEVFLSTRWLPSEVDPAKAAYGLLPAIAGTLATALIAVSVALPLSLALTVFIEELAPGRVRDALSSLVDVMAGMPTIVYGVWGIGFLAPALAPVYARLSSSLGFIPLFSCEPTGGFSVLTAGLLLAIMIIPFVFAVVKEAYRAIPATYREAALSLGMTRYEYTRLLMGMIKPAIIAGVLLGFGRAASETVAVALVIGNAFNLPLCIIGPGITISSLIANQFGEANLYPLMQNVLYLGGLVLLVLGLISNFLGILMLTRVRVRV